MSRLNAFSSSDSSGNRSSSGPILLVPLTPSSLARPSSVAGAATHSSSLEIRLPFPDLPCSVTLPPPFAFSENTRASRCLIFSGVERPVTAARGQQSRVFLSRARFLCDRIFHGGTHCHRGLINRGHRTFIPAKKLLACWGTILTFSVLPHTRL